MGEEGFIEVAKKSYDNAHKLADELSKKGYKILSQDFFDEFVVEVQEPNLFLAKMRAEGILAGLKVDDNKVLVCASELNTEDDIKEYIQNA